MYCCGNKSPVALALPGVFMKDSLKSLFCRVTGGLLFAPDAPDFPALTAPVAAIAVPDRAKFGNLCSTRAFFTIQDHVEWQTGHQGADGLWSLRKITEMPNMSGAAAAIGDMVQKTNTIKTGLGFFDAITALAVYEQGQLALNVLPADTDTKNMRNALAHYTAFAEREGIVFDTSGTPHPTLNGEVMGDGIFTKAALERARAVQAAQSSFALQGGNDFLGALIQPANDNADQFAATIQNTLNGSYLADIIERVERIDSLVEYGFFTKIYLTEAVKIIVDEINDSIDKLSMPQAQKASLHSDIASLGLYYEVTALRYRAQHATRTEYDRRNAFQALQNAAPKLEARFLELGGTPDNMWKIKSVLLEKFSANQPGVKPQAIADLLQSLRVLRSGLLQEEIKTTRMVVAGPHMKHRTSSRGPG